MVHINENNLECAAHFGLVFGSVLQKKLQFSFRFRKISCSFVFFGSILHSSFDAILHLRICSMMLEMTYFCAELVQLIVSRSDSEQEVQRYGMKKNTVTVDPIMLQDEL